MAAPREALWGYRNQIIRASRTIPAVKEAMEQAGREGLVGDSVFLAVAATLAHEHATRAHDRRLLEQERYALEGKVEMLKGKIAFMEASNKGSITTRIRRFINGKRR